jgi:hypothetical protein
MNLQKILTLIMVFSIWTGNAQISVTLMKNTSITGEWKFTPYLYIIAGFQEPQPKSIYNSDIRRGNSVISERQDIVLKTVDSICLEGICIIERNALVRGTVRYLGPISRLILSGNSPIEEQYDQFVITLNNVETKKFGFLRLDKLNSTDTIEISQHAASKERRMLFSGTIKEDYSFTVKREIPDCIQDYPNSKELPQKRLALVIGNAQYKFISGINNSCNDAQDMLDTLSQWGFTVIYRENLSTLEMLDAIRAFRDSLLHYDVGWFYFAGHGVEVDKIKYLIPVNASLKHRDYLAKEAIELQYVESALQGKIGFIIVDACRNNPFEFSSDKGFRGIILEQHSSKGSLLSVFATSSGKMANDRHPNGRNGKYTGCLFGVLTQTQKCFMLNNIFSIVEGLLENQTATHTSEGMGLYYLTK